MSIRNKYEAELKQVFDKLIEMCHVTERAIELSVSALKNRDVALAKNVIADDTKIDAMERDIEQDCLSILLLEHPFAGDFREVSAALKMITDLERIADQAADISEISLQFGAEDFIKEPKHIEEMSRLVIAMVLDAVTSYIKHDRVQ